MRRSLALGLWRAFERVAAGLVLLLLAPLLLLLVVWIRLDSPGPALFRQARLGRGARAFEVLKLRTMRAGAEDGIPQARRGVIESDADPRITRAGRLLRRTSLDELPQLWNVVRGEMALVGPRPVLPEQREAMPPWAERRFAVPPGLTGLAQVRGRRSLGWLEQLRADCAFVRRDSVRLRVRILLGTLPALLRTEAVYGGARANWRAYLPDEADARTDPSGRAHAHHEPAAPDGRDATIER